jgi:hypothetical protein
MKKTFRYLLLVAMSVGIGVQRGDAARLPLPAPASQAAPANDPIVGTYENVRYGTTFNFQADGTITGADGVGDGSWQVSNAAKHIYIVKIRPAKMGSPDRYEPWTLMLEDVGLTQDKGQTVVFRHVK